MKLRVPLRKLSPLALDNLAHEWCLMNGAAQQALTVSGFYIRLVVYGALYFAWIGLS